MGTTETCPAGAWLTGRQASRLSGRNQHTLLKLALLGRLRYRADRGESIRYHRDDLARLASDD